MIIIELINKLLNGCKEVWVCNKLERGNDLGDIVLISIDLVDNRLLYKAISTNMHKGTVYLDDGSTVPADALVVVDMEGEFT